MKTNKFYFFVLILIAANVLSLNVNAKNKKTIPVNSPLPEEYINKMDVIFINNSVEYIKCNPFEKAIREARWYPQDTD